MNLNQIKEALEAQQIALDEFAKHLIRQERRLDQVIRALPIKSMGESSSLSAIALADKVQESSAFQFLARGMKDRQAFRICALLVLDGQCFDDLDALCKDALEEQDEEFKRAEEKSL